MAEVSAQMVMDDVTGVQLERFGIVLLFRQHDGRIERTQPAGGAVRDKMDVRILIEMILQIGGGSGLITLEHTLTSGGKMPGYARHLVGGF